MATISGGSKPTFTVDQVLHAAEMNQLNQEWIVDSVPLGSAGKNGDVVFVTSKGGVWAKVSGSWVQASLTSADMQATTDALDGKSDTGHTHDTTHDHNGQYAGKLEFTEHHHDGDYSATDHTHPPQDLTHNHSGEYQPVGDYATNTELSDGLANKSDNDHVHIQAGSGLTFDPDREGQVVQSTNGTDWTAGMSLRVVTSVPDDTEGEIGDVVFVVGA